MPLVLAGATSGSATIQATDAQTVTITMPATSGTLVTTGGAQTIEFADGSAAAPSITNSGDTNTGMFFPAADTIAFTEGGTESMRIDASGNLGIGTTNPSRKLTVANTSATNTALLSNILARFEVNGSGADCSLQFSDTVTNSAGISMNQGNIVTTIAGGEVMRMTTAGNLGIGATSPNSKLELRSSQNANVDLLRLNNPDANGLGTKISFTQGSDIWGETISEFSSGWRMKHCAGSPTGTTAGSAGYHVFFTNNGSASYAERMRIDSSGNLLVGTTSIGNVLSGSNIRFGKDGFGVEVSQYILSRNNGEAVDIQVATGESYSGILMANVSNASNATVATRIAYAIGCRGTSGTATALMTNNGSSGGYSFSVSFPSNGVVRITNTGGSVANIYGTFYCGIGS